MKKLIGLLLLIITLYSANNARGSETFPVFMLSPDTPVNVTFGKERLLLEFSEEPASRRWEFIDAVFEFQMAARKEGNQPNLAKMLENVFLLDVAEKRRYPVKLTGKYANFSSGSSALTNMPGASQVKKTFRIFADLTGGWRTGDSLTVSLGRVLAMDVGDSSLGVLALNVPESVLAVENPEAISTIIQEPGGTITSVELAPSTKKGETVMRLTATCTPGPYMYMVQGTRDFVSWLSLIGSTVNPDGRLSLEVVVPNDVFGLPPSGGGVFMRLKVLPFP